MKIKMRCDFSEQIYGMSYDTMRVMKDGYSYGRMNIGNRTSGEIVPEEGVIFGVAIDYYVE